MKSRDFVYWLQGSFEIGDLKELSENQVSIIKVHLKMVFAHEKKPEFDFVHWLDGFLSPEGGPLNQKETQRLREKLNGVFEHEIDPTFKDKDHLEKIHEAAGRKGRTSPHFGPLDPHTTRIMC